MEEEILRDAEVVVDEAEPYAQGGAEPAPLPMGARSPGSGLTVAEPAAVGALFGASSPSEVLARASEAAGEFKDVLQRQGMLARIQGRDHVTVDGWQTLGAMLAVYPVKEFVRPLPWPDEVDDRLLSLKSRGYTFGYEASFRAQRADGTVVGGGEAECKRTEKTWKDREDYALKSMAQTRATSKALKGPLGFVVTLAGYSPTPAEEMVEQSAQAGPQFGPPASEKLSARLDTALLWLMRDVLPLAVEAREQIEKWSGGYLPANAAQAVVLAIKTYKDADLESASNQGEPE